MSDEKYNECCDEDNKDSKKLGYNPNSSFWRQARKSAREVKDWPEWKKRVLADDHYFLLSQLI